MEEQNFVDARGLSCPMPLVLTKKALDKNNGTVYVTVNDPVTRDNVKTFAETRKYNVCVKSDGDDYILIIEKRN